MLVFSLYFILFNYINNYFQLKPNILWSTRFTYIYIVFLKLPCVQITIERYLRVFDCRDDTFNSIEVCYFIHVFKVDDFKVVSVYYETSKYIWYPYRKRKGKKKPPPPPVPIEKELFL